MQLNIRTATPADAPDLSYICVATADAGVSAIPLHNHQELCGLVWALPYLHIPPPLTFAFVLEVQGQETKKVVGYVIGAVDTCKFEQEMRRVWWPRWQIKYPLVSDPTDSSQPERTRTRTPKDQTVIGMINAPESASEPVLRFSPAHLHIDILPEYQRRGYGRKLIGAAIGHLRDVHGLKSVYLQMDLRNTEAAKFYERLGFEELSGEGIPKGTVGMKFENWPVEWDVVVRVA